jgi:hypothetical protein
MRSRPDRSSDFVARLLERRPSPALVIALLALFVALGGTTYAVQRLPKRSVGSAQLRTDAVHNRSIKAGAVSRSKIRRKAVTADQVGTDALIGRNILESSLSKVPDADKLDGLDSSRFVRGTRIDRFPLGDGQTLGFYEAGPLTLTARCDFDLPSPSGADRAVIELTSSAQGVADSGSGGSTLTPGVPLGLVSASNGGGSGAAFDGIGAGHALTADGTEISGMSLYAGVNLPGFPSRCMFGGYVLTP